MRLPGILQRLVAAKDRAPVVGGAKGQDAAEKVMVEALRTLSQVCVKVADVIEAQRLTRQGYEGQGKFLERLDRPDEAQRPPPGRDEQK